MANPVLVIMAAGMGSRYGGLKQIDPIGPNGQILLDYSIYDAHRAGFDRVVFIIRPELHEAFEDAIGKKARRFMQVDYAYQTLDNLPDGLTAPEGREKPLGTAHAVWCAKELTAGCPIAVINADDFYGADAFRKMYDYLSAAQDDDKFRYCMVGYQVENTLTENGTVSRGVCTADENGLLAHIIERTAIHRDADGVIRYDADGDAPAGEIAPGTPVSLNLWGFTPSFLPSLDDGLREFFAGKLPNLPERDLARTMSVLLTEHVRPELMTCWDVAAAGRYPYTGRLGLLSDEDRAKVDEALALVGADELADRDFSCISDGQRQRVLLARAICQEPEVIVLDEPTSFLDIRYKLELLTVLKQLVREKQVAVILSLHEIDLAQKLSDRLICVHNGRIERCGTPEQVFTGDYIRTLYDLERGTYNEQFGSLELERVTGEPRVFVIGGGGSGTALYRRLQRRGIPFAAGVLPENDVELPTARALAVETVTERAYQPIGEDAYARAQALVRQCGNAVCCLDLFGPVNEKNRVLRDWAQQEGLLRSKSELENIT